MGGKKISAAHEPEPRALYTSSGFHHRPFIADLPGMNANYFSSDDWR